MAKAQEGAEKWYLLDVKGKTLGRVATQLAHILRGKHKAIFTPHTDTGDFVVVINAAQVRVTGNKFKDKIYYHHTGYPGGIKQENFADLQARIPERAIELAVRGMLPKNPLGRKMFRKLKIYAGSDHPHQAQQPVKLADDGICGDKEG